MHLGIANLLTPKSDHQINDSRLLSGVIVARPLPKGSEHEAAGIALILLGAYLIAQDQDS